MVDLAGGKDAILLTALAGALGANPDDAVQIAKNNLDKLNWVGSPSQGWEFIQAIKAQIPEDGPTANS